jgi:hypothetical protein
MGKLSQFRLDGDKSIEGVWHKFAAGIEIKIARMHNPEFDKYYAEISESHLGDLRRRSVDAELRTELMKKAVARCIIRDWRNIEDDNGKAIKYTPEKAYEIISDPANLLFYEFVLDASLSVNSFFEEQKEQAEKN